MDEKEFLNNYNPNKYRTPDGLPVDNCIFTIISENNSENRKRLPIKKLKIVLIKRKVHPFKDMWALPGGFSKESESLLEAAKRELLQETNINNDVHIQQLRTIYYPERDPRGWIPTVVYYSLVNEKYLKNLQASDDAKEVRLFNLTEISKLDLAFDHKQIILDAYEKVKDSMLTSTIAKEFLPEEFTITELLQVIQCVVPEFNVEKPNFIQKVVGTKSRKGLLVESINQKGEQKFSNEFSQRPAKLYRFNENYEVKLSIYNSTFI